MLFGRNQKKPITLPEKKVEEWVYTTYGYCSTGCSIEVGVAGKEPAPGDDPPRYHADQISA